MGRSSKRRQGQRQPAICHYAGSDERPGCERLSVVARGSVPLCGACDRAASTLTREPRRPAPAAVDHLAELRRLRTREYALAQQVDQQLAAAAEAGCSYVDIGQALGVTRQAARQRHLRR